MTRQALSTPTGGVWEGAVAPKQFFLGHEEARVIFDAARKPFDTIGPNDVHVTESQVAFRRRPGFVFVWMPEMYFGDRGVPLVLTIGLRRRDGSARWKEIVEPAPGRFTHHLELRSVVDVDDEKSAAGCARRGGAQASVLGTDREAGRGDRGQPWFRGLVRADTLFRRASCRTTHFGVRRLGDRGALD